jgi:hypothetical protein
MVICFMGILRASPNRSGIGSHYVGKTWPVLRGCFGKLARRKKTLIFRDLKRALYHFLHEARQFDFAKCEFGATLQNSNTLQLASAEQWEPIGREWGTGRGSGF